MTASQIRPDATRLTFAKAITAAEAFSNAAAMTGDDELMRTAARAQREAWSALARFDAR